MNTILLVAGIAAAATSIGHFFVGGPKFLTPMLSSQFDRIPKRVMHCVFHYMSVFLILSTGVLLLAGFGVRLGSDPTLLVRFISVNFAGFALCQLVVAVTSGIPNGVFKLFQWIFFAAISVCAFLGTL